jgi:hypothetical protein
MRRWWLGRGQEKVNGERLARSLPHGCALSAMGSTTITDSTGAGFARETHKIFLSFPRAPQLADSHRDTVGYLPN